jgi:hypothetical protein
VKLRDIYRYKIIVCNRQQSDVILKLDFVGIALASELFQSPVNIFVVTKECGYNFHIDVWMVGRPLPLMSVCT